MLVEDVVDLLRIEAGREYSIWPCMLFADPTLVLDNLRIDDSLKTRVLLNRHLCWIVKCEEQPAFDGLGFGVKSATRIAVLEHD